MPRPAATTPLQVTHDWYDSGGPVAERTNTVINGLLEWAAAEDVDRIHRSTVRSAIEQLTPVGTRSTVTEYNRRVVRHGPFVQVGTGSWTIEWDRVGAIATEAEGR